MRVRLSLLVFVVCLCAAPCAHALKQPLGPELSISDPSPSIGQVAVAPDSDTGHYLVVWQDDKGLRGRLIGRDGAPLTDVIAVSDGAFGSSPSAAYNARLNEYLVAWTGTVPPSYGAQVIAQRFSPSGAKIGGRIHPWPSDTYQVSVACIGRSGTCVVTWSGFGIHDGLIGPGGVPGGPATDLVCSCGQIRRATQSVWVGSAPEADRHLFVWNDLGAVFAGGGLIAGTGYVSAPPVYDPGTREFAVLYSSGSQIIGTRVGENGDVTGAGDVVRGFARLPSFAFDSHDRSYLVGWQSTNGGTGSGSFLAADLTPIAPADFAGDSVVTYNAADDEYLLARSCPRPGGLEAVCGRRVGNPPAAADRTGPRLRVTMRRLQRILRQRGLVLRARCDEACVVSASARVGVTAVKLRPAKTSLTPGAGKRMKLRATKQILRALRRALGHRTRLKVRLDVTATDRAGNRTIAKRKLKARR